MKTSTLKTLLSKTLFCTLLLPVHSFTSYANDFVDPDDVLSKSFNKTTLEAQATIVAWADDLAANGGSPWTVTSKTIMPPSQDKHDYVSWAPYSWPNCTGVGNTTELTPEQIWVTCPYYTRDGLFNPDARLVNDVGAFGNMSDAVFYNALAWAINGSSIYSANVAQYIQTWFVDPDTAMNPNLNFAQMARGPNGQVGQHTGVLDLKCMTKLVSAVLILRQGKAVEWTSDLDTQLTNWTSSYMTWLETSSLGKGEEAAANNHGTFFYNQLAALQILVGDNNGAKDTLEKYFTTQYKKQIAANGDQPLETARTRPYHYRAYNLAAMITNAKLGAYIGYDVWNLTTDAGTNIKSALDYAMTLPAGSELASELYPNIVAVGSVYGDPDGTYAKFLLQNAGTSYPADAQFLWNQPFSDSGLSESATSTGASPTNTGSAARNQNGARKTVSGCLTVGLVACTIVLHSLFGAF